ncbi:hypothetical protein JKF63_00604 [Porcisia hertigi]|uniref:Uncharacterized protein n=1 Tax=Porcisia hertigi TaxID=2761500 RepID=A0A836HDE5_9TRYP|nr:hypothetical protein JKF63_00604 [Porcisia hertigi]
MPAPALSSGRARSTGLKRNNAGNSGFAGINFDVQDRRLNTRLLNEAQRRKAQLLGLATRAVAHQLHRYTVPPSFIMDEGCRGVRRTRRSAMHSSTNADDGKGKSGTAMNILGETDTSSGIDSPTESSPSPDTNAYSRWLQHCAQDTTKEDGARRSSLLPPLSPRRRSELTDSGLSLPLSASYEEWLSAGCPVGPWSALLEEELYAPAEAEQAFLCAKYDTHVSPRS